MTLHDPNFVEKHLGPDAFRIDPLITRTTPTSRRVRDVSQLVDEEISLESNVTSDGFLSCRRIMIRYMTPLQNGHKNRKLGIDK